MKRDFKGIWIPAEIWLSEELTLQEKVFFVEIDSLDNDEGCFANNEYFAKFFGISKTRVSIVINELVKKGFITSTIIYKEGTKQILKRVLKVCCIGYQRKVKEGIKEKFIDNNTSNNTDNNTDNKEESKIEILPDSEKIDDQPLLFEQEETEKKKKVAPKKKKGLVLVWPESFSSSIINNLKDYLQMRKENGKPLKSQMAFSRMCNDCEKILFDYGEEVLLNSINKAIASQWMSIHPKPVNNQTTTNGNKSKQGPYDHLFKAILKG